MQASIPSSSQSIYNQEPPPPPPYVHTGAAVITSTQQQVNQQAVPGTLRYHLDTLTIVLVENGASIRWLAVASACRFLCVVVMYTCFEGELGPEPQFYTDRTRRYEAPWIESRG